MLRPNLLVISAVSCVLLVFYFFSPFGLHNSALRPPHYRPSTDPHEGPTVEWAFSSDQGSSDANYDYKPAYEADQDHSNGEQSLESAHQAVPDHSNEQGSHDSAHEAQESHYVDNEEHPIPRLIREAELRYSSMLASRSQTVEEAARAYRARRGRHPPPGFDLWFKYARDNGAIIVEEFWDQIYHDLEPFWAVPPAQIRAQARALGMAVMVKNGHTDIHTDWFWHVIWKRMIDEVAFMLSDMLIPLNSMDEPRVMVPWAKITDYITIADENKSITAASSTRRTVQGWWEEPEDSTPEIPDIEWHRGAPYSFAREACSPSSAIRGDYKLHNSGSVPLASSSSKNWTTSHQFVENSTLGSDTCQDPAIAAYHGALISPNTGSTSQILQPLFGGSKFAVNNDILLPAPMYWNGEERFEMGDPTLWAGKQDTVIWRGTATGGRHNAMNWPHFHRHRFLALANGTKFEQAGDHDRIFTPAHQQAAINPLPTSIQKNLAKWLNKRNDVAFTDLFCDLPMPKWGTCWYLDEEYTVSLGLSLSQQFRMKYLPDIDGNSFSGRYRSFLLSRSLPIKATLYREWHDSRLIAWKHFVPMNNRFSDYYSLLAYFVGCEADVCGEDGVVDGHDKEAENIAMAGKEWAEKVLRKVDMQIYVARVLLEFGRVTDDDREMVGWVDDLIGDVKTEEGASDDVGNVEEDPEAAP